MNCYWETTLSVTIWLLRYQRSNQTKVKVSARFTELSSHSATSIHSTYFTRMCFALTGSHVRRQSCTACTFARRRSLRFRLEAEKCRESQVYLALTFTLGRFDSTVHTGYMVPLYLGSHGYKGISFNVGSIFALSCGAVLLIKLIISMNLEYKATWL